MTFGAYVLEQEIAAGGMGVVYRARHVELGRTVAVKLLLLGRHASAESIDRFRREARSAAALNHPNIVTIHDVGEFEGQHFLTMDFVDGRNLAEELRLSLPSPRRAAERLRVLAEAIQHAHVQGVVHRDLKPSNILIDSLGAVRITDFGLAKQLDGSGDLTETGRVLGSPYYLSPEAAAGHTSTLGPLSDIYALGAVLYEMLTGRPPFLAATLTETLLRIRESEPVAPRALNPGIPRDLETICLRCLEKDPVRRFPTAQALADDLGRWLDGRPIEARPAGRAERLWKWSRRQPRLAAMSAVTLLAVTLALVTLGVSNVSTRAARRQAETSAEARRRSLLRLNVQTGNRLVNEGEALTGLAWFVEALALAGDDAASNDLQRRRLGAVLRLSPGLDRVWFHDAFVTDVRFSPDGAQVAAAALDHPARLWDVASGQAVILADPLLWIRFSPDDRTFFGGLTNGMMRLYARPDGSPVRHAHDIPVGQRAAFDPLGRWIAIASSNEVRRLDPATWLPAAPTLKSDQAILELRFTPGGNRLLAYGDQNGVTVWTFGSEPPGSQSVDLGDRILFLTVRSDEERIVAVCRGPNHQDLHVRQWDLVTGELLGRDLTHASGVTGLHYSPDGRRVVTAVWGGTAQLWDAETSEKRGAPMQHQAGVRNARFSPDGRDLATASWDMTARRWDPETGQPRPPLLRHGGFVTELAYSPDSRQLLTGCQDMAVRLWRMPPAEPARLTLRHGATVHRVRYDSAGTRLISASVDGTARVSSRDTGDRLFELRHRGPVFEACFMGNDRWILTGSADGTARLWDASSGEPVGEVMDHGQPLSGIVLSPDERIVATLAGHEVRLWDAVTGRSLTGPLIHPEPVTRAAFAPDGRRLITGSADGRARFWETASGTPTGLELAVGRRISAIAFSPDGREVTTARLDDTQLPTSAQRWDARTGARIDPPLHHLDGIFHVEYSRDGRRILTCGEDSSARVWDAASGEPLTPPMRHSAYVEHAAFSPDGRLVATSSWDGTARVWEVEGGEAVTPPLRHGARLSWVCWSPDGREIAAGSSEQFGPVFDVSPVAGSIEELRREAELLGSQRLHPTAGASPLTTAELRARWQARQGR
jgi:eukaryotic-like serine/threonine-protein kinase